MIICESQFEREDPDRKGYSHAEVDWYAWIPQGSDLDNHRLSLRKNLVTGEFEVYRRFFEKVLISRGKTTIITGKDTRLEEVAFKSKDLATAIRYADGQYAKYHGTEEEPERGDKVCQHTTGLRAWGCQVSR